MPYARRSSGWPRSFQWLSGGGFWPGTPGRWRGTRSARSSLLEVRHAAGLADRADHLWRDLGPPWSAGFHADPAAWPEALRTLVARSGCLPPADVPPFEWAEGDGGSPAPFDCHPDGLPLPPGWATWRAQITACHTA
ncbi:MAG TPA: hypothetical protein VM597_11380 [Gemmataceae bacterium]|nr:hypothetical protein [Gemmataceae bacterium]